MRLKKKIQRARMALIVIAIIAVLICVYSIFGYFYNIKEAERLENEARELENEEIGSLGESFTNKITAGGLRVQAAHLRSYATFFLYIVLPIESIATIILFTGARFTKKGTKYGFVLFASIISLFVVFPFCIIPIIFTVKAKEEFKELKKKRKDEQSQISEDFEQLGVKEGQIWKEREERNTEVSLSNKDYKKPLKWRIAISTTIVMVLLIISGVGGYLWYLQNNNNKQNEKIIYHTMSISDIPDKPNATFESGKHVYIHGIVVSEIANYSTAYTFWISDMNSNDELLVHIPKNLVNQSGAELYSEDDLVYNLLTGSRISILGSLTYWESPESPQYDRWVLVPTSLGKEKKISGKYCFEILEEGDGVSLGHMENQGVTVDILMSNKERYEGFTVKIKRAIIDQVESRSIYIKDQGGTNILLVFSYDELDGFEVGEQISLRGQFTKYEDQWEIKISKDTHYIHEVN